MHELERVRFHPPSSRQLLARVLDERELVMAIQHLPPRALTKLIEHVGLEDAGELIALATTEQLEKVFDEDLWRSPRPGEDEVFDAARFVLWLEVMLEAGAAFTARRVAELPEDLVVDALHRQILVVDMDALGAEIAVLGEDADQLEKVLGGSLHHELDTYRVIARSHDGWDAILAVLVALDEQHHDVLVRILERCCALSSRDVEDHGGLYDVLSSAETLATDVAADREQRRAGEGFIAPSSAAAFLRYAAKTELATLRREGRDPITRAYFRELAPPPPIALPAAAEGLVALLRANAVLDLPEPALLLPASDSPEARFRGALSELLDRDPVLHQRRRTELVYLANVLVAGADAGGRAFRPAEAAAAVITTCGLGLAYLAGEDGKPDHEIMTRDGADTLFRIGWHLLAERHGDPAAALLPVAAWKQQEEDRCVR